MKTTMIIFLVAELVAVLILLFILDWEGDTTQNFITIGLVGTSIWGIYERYGKLGAEKQVKSMEENFHKYKGRE